MIRLFRNCAIAATLLCLLAPQAFGAARLSNQMPPTHFLSKAMDLYAEKVAEYSGGKETVQVFHSGQLYQDTTVVEAVQDGLVELALLPANKWAGMLPAIDIFEMPFVFKDQNALHRFLDEGGAALLDDEFKKLNVKVMFWADYGDVHIFNNKRALLAPEDFKGVKIRTFGKASTQAIEALGGSPTMISSAEMYMALQRGTVDGAVTGVPAAVSRKVYEVQKHMTVAGLSAVEFVLQANLDWWNNLSPEAKEAHLRASKEVSAFISRSVAEEEAKALETVKAAGLQISVPTPEQRAVLQKATAPVLEAFAKTSGEVGKKLLEITTKANK